MSEVPGFFSELKRRHVWRVAVAYAIVAWLVVQLASVLFPTFGTPAWVLKTVIALLAIGFPVALVLAWAYEMTPTGIRRTAPADSPEARPEHDSRAVGRKLNTVIIGVLVLAVVLLSGNQFLWHRGMRTSTVTTQTARSPDGAKRNPGTATPDFAAGAAASGLPNANAQAAAIPAKSVAVLPFTNESGDKDQQFFSDGLSEDLINTLSQFEGLKVISRNSAFQFRGSKDSSAKIGQLLGVAHLLEGSVQRAGDTVRITATLVNAADGSTLWSEHYDKPYKDLFALQDEITQSVAAALQAKLLTAPGAMVQSDRPPSGNLDAWNAYLQGRFHDDRGSEVDDREAIAEYAEATRLDPRYAAAHAALSSKWTDLAGFFLSGAEQQNGFAKARAAAQTALRLNPGSAVAHVAYASVLTNADMDWHGARSELQRAFALAADDASVQFNLSANRAALGQVKSAVDVVQQALTRNPLQALWTSFLAKYQAGLGRYDDADASARKAVALQPQFALTHRVLTFVTVLRGNAAAALAAAQRTPAGRNRDIAIAWALQIGPDRNAADAALAHLIKTDALNSRYQIAEAYALRRDPDSMFKWLDRAESNRDGGLQYLLYDPLILRYRNDPRFAAFAKKVGLPTTTDAVAMK